MSKFRGILDAAKKGEQAPPKHPTRPKQPTPTKTTGRPRGKRSNPDYEQVTAYIRRETHRNIKIALLQESGMDDFSELVERLLKQWLKSR